MNVGVALPYVNHTFVFHTVFTVSQRYRTFNNRCVHRVQKFKWIYIELPKYYAPLQAAVARGLGLPASWLAERHTDAAPKHSLCYFSSVSE